MYTLYAQEMKTKTHKKKQTHTNKQIKRNKNTILYYFAKGQLLCRCGILVRSIEALLKKDNEMISR